MARLSFVQASAPIAGLETGSKRMLFALPCHLRGESAFLSKSVPTFARH